MELNISDVTSYYYNGYNLYRKQNLRKLTERTVTAYEIELFTHSEGGIITDGEYIPFEPGTICIRTPGQVVQGINPYNCYSLRFKLFPPGILGKLPSKLSAEQAVELKEHIETIHKNRMLTHPGAQFTTQAHLYLLLERLCAYSTDRPDEVQAGRRLSDCFSYIHRHLSEPISVEQLQDVAGLSKSQFHKVFLSYTGTTPNAYITNLRLERAKTLLLETDLKISVIADQCGFSEPAYFTYVFRKTFGIAPLAYRNRG